MSDQGCRWWCWARSRHCQGRILAARWAVRCGGVVRITDGVLGRRARALERSSRWCAPVRSRCHRPGRGHSVVVMVPDDRQPTRRVDVSTATTGPRRPWPLRPGAPRSPAKAGTPGLERAGVKILALDSRRVDAERDDHHIRECGEFHRSRDEVGVVRRRKRSSRRARSLRAGYTAWSSTCSWPCTIVAHFERTS